LWKPVWARLGPGGERRWQGMLRWILFVFSLLFFGMAALTWVKAPTLTTWKLAILADEYGHFLFLLPVGVAVVAWVTSRGSFSFVTAGTLLVSGLAVGGFLRPTFSARRISAELPERLAAAFGPIDVGRSPLELARLATFGGGETVKVTSHTFSGAGTADALVLDFYPAARTGGSLAPCVIVIHGGGWDSGDRKQLPSLNHRLAQRGYSVAAIGYRLAPKHVWPAQRQDVLSAIAFLKAEAGVFGIDRNRLVLFGRSAGGQLATAVGYSAHDPAIRGVIAFYSPHDLHFAWRYAKPDDVLNSFKLLRAYLGGAPSEKKDAYDRSSAYLQVSPRVPPTLLVHGELDTLVWHKQSERLDRKLTESGVPHLFLSLPWGTHAFDFNPQGPGGQLSTYAIEHFLAAVMR